MDNKDSQLMRISPDEQLIKNYQAIYYAMNAKPDSKSKLFDRDVVITMEDLRNLNHRITEKFKAHYEDAGFRINVSISFKDRETIEFDSWTVFENYNLNTEKSINSILIVWEYNAKLPGFQWPQRHTLTVRLADELRLEEMLNLVVSGKLEEVDKLDQEICPIVARVDFINSMLGDELINIVGSWQKGLMAPSIDENICFKFLKKYSRIIAYFINYTTLFVAIYCCLHYVIKWIMGLEITYLGEMTIIDTGEFVSLIIRSIVFCCVVYKIFQIVANIVFSSLRTTSNNHTFNITNGDRVLSQKIEKRIKNRRFKIIANLILTFLFNICCNLVSSMIIG